MRQIFDSLDRNGVRSGCETPKVTREEMDSVNYGPAPLHWKEEILGWLKLRLRDPEGRDRRVSAPSPSRCSSSRSALDPQVARLGGMRVGERQEPPGRLRTAITR